VNKTWTIVPTILSVITSGAHSSVSARLAISGTLDSVWTPTLYPPQSHPPRNPHRLPPIARLLLHDHRHRHHQHPHSPILQDTQQGTPLVTPLQHPPARPPSTPHHPQQRRAKSRISTANFSCFPRFYPSPSQRMERPLWSSSIPAGIPSISQDTNSVGPTMSNTTTMSAPSYVDRWHPIRTTSSAVMFLSTRPVKQELKYPCLMRCT